LCIINNRILDMDNIKISVITVCWNCVGDIEKTLKSVIGQTYPNIEYIIVDGASTDGTLEIVERYRDNISTLISEPDGGIYNAMNKGVRVATGQWCIFMNAGDVFASKDVVSEMFSINHPKKCTKVYYGNTTDVNEKQKEVSFKATSVFPAILRCQPYCHQSAFFNIKDKREPFFNEKYKIASDYNTSLEYFVKYGKDAFEYRNLIISKFAAYGGVSTNKKNDKKKHLEFIDIYKNHKICHKRYLIERFKFFIFYQQPLHVLSSMLKKYTESRTQSNQKNRLIR